MSDEVLIPRAVAEQCRELVERVLRFTETPERELVTLQHKLAELLRDPTAPAGSSSVQALDARNNSIQP